jgi:hypothetical protein
MRLSSLFSDLLERIRAIVFHARDERELDEELRTHMEMEAEYRRQRRVRGGRAPSHSAASSA